MIVFILYTREHSKQVVHKLTSFNLQTWHLYTIYSFISVQGVAYIASVSVGFGSKETEERGFRYLAWAENGARAKKRTVGVGEEPLADKPLDFENPRSLANGPRDWLG